MLALERTTRTFNTMNVGEFINILYSKGEAWLSLWIDENMKVSAFLYPCEEREIPIYLEELTPELVLYLSQLFSEFMAYVISRTSGEEAYQHRCSESHQIQEIFQEEARKIGVVIPHQSTLKPVTLTETVAGRIF